MPEALVRRLARRCLALVLAPGLLAAPAAADPVPSAARSAAATPVVAAPSEPRIGDHPGFGRIVFDLPHGSAAASTREGDRLLLRFAAPDPIATPPRVPRNVLGLLGGTGQAQIQVAPGAEIRSFYIGRRLIVDVFDPPGASRPAASRSDAEPRRHSTAAHPPPVPAAAPLAAAPEAREPVASEPLVTAARTAEPGLAAPVASAPIPPPPAKPPTPAATAVLSPPQPAPSPQPASSPPPAPAAPAAVAKPAGGAPVALAAARLPNTAAISLPFAVTTGAAAFRRGGIGEVVFDEARPIDLAALRDDPSFGAATVQMLPGATLLRLALPAGAELRLAKIPAGWTVTLAQQPPPLHPIEPAVAEHRIELPADAPGQIVVVPDPGTGENLLVGTQRQPGQGVAVVRHTPEFNLLPTWQGVLVEPLSDRAALHIAAPPAHGGFVVAAALPGQGGLAISSPPADAAQQADAAQLTRRFDFPDLPTPALFRRMQEAIVAAASAAPLARLVPRRDAAQAMIALGLGAEAQALLQLAVTDDPRGVDDPGVVGLSAIAAMLAGRVSDNGGAASAGIEDARLNGTDEVALWRAVRAAMQGDAANAAPVFANALKLLLSYPAALRTRLLPLAAESMVLGGRTKEAAALLASRQDDPSLALARGMLAQLQGDTAGALAAYDRLAESPDRLVRARAATRAVELRLASGQLTAQQAADADERLFYSWRGDGRELALRLRTASLRAQAGQWRQALALLRETEQSLPDDHDQIHARLLETFAGLMRDDQADRLAPLELVALVQENADLLPEGPAGEAMVAKLADRLAALDLPRQAAPVFEKLMRSAGGAGARGEFGARLAGLRLEEGDSAGALAALSESASDTLSPALVQRRTLLLARATAAAGDVKGAVAALAPLATPAADEARAAIFENAKEWPAAEAALAAYAASTVPAQGKLSDAQSHTVLRWASAAAQAGDEAALAQLRRREAARMAEGPLGEMFRVLTERPVISVADLPRAAKETQAARGALQAMGAP